MFYDVRSVERARELAAAARIRMARRRAASPAPRLTVADWETRDRPGDILLVPPMLGTLKPGVPPSRSGSVG